MMDNEPKRRNPFSRAFRLLVETRWLFTFSASVCATIVGISLTFGINSCRESQRVRKEVRKSMLQAVDNLKDRLEEARRWVDIINNESRLFEVADSMYTSSGRVSDSICMEFYNSLPYIRISAFDHEFEKIFRGSYQLWQLQKGNDSLTFYISQCYDGLNMVEQTCQELTDGMIEQLGAVNAEKHFYRAEPVKWTTTLVSDPQFQYYMSVRHFKASLADYILWQTYDDFENHVIPLSSDMTNE